jgi:hypothetical protein
MTETSLELGRRLRFNKSLSLSLSLSLRKIPRFVPLFSVFDRDTCLGRESGFCEETVPSLLCCVVSRYTCCITWSESLEWICETFLYSRNCFLWREESKKKTCLRNQKIYFLQRIEKLDWLWRFSSRNSECSQLLLKQTSWLNFLRFLFICS